MHAAIAVSTSAMRSGLLAVAASLAGILLASTPGKADFRICNFSASTADIAFGYYEQQEGWTSRGWMKLLVGECKIALKGPLQSGTYYLHGHSQDGRVFEGQPPGGASFCIQPQKFELHSNAYTSQNTLNCEANGLKTARFMPINVTEAEFTYTLTPDVGQSSSVPMPPARQELQSGGNANEGVGTDVVAPNQPKPEVPRVTTSMQAVPSGQQDVPQTSPRSSPGGVITHVTVPNPANYISPPSR